MGGWGSAVKRKLALTEGMRWAQGQADRHTIFSLFYTHACARALLLHKGCV